MEDSISLHSPSSNKTPGSRKHVLVWFVTGNPGLIEYYRTYFKHLLETLCTRDQDSVYHVEGVSLAGFEQQQQGHGVQAGANEAALPPFTLDEQIEYVRHEIERAILVRLSAIDAGEVASDREHGHEGRPSLDIVLVGHSVGAFIALEIIAAWQAAARAREESGDQHEDARLLSTTAASALDRCRIRAGIGLFPTIVDIAASPSGRKITPLLRLPGFAWCIGLLSKLIFTFVPLHVAIMLVRVVTRMPYDAAKVTACFLKSKHGVYQALFMAQCEMAQITNDKWTDQFWGHEAEQNGDVEAKEAAVLATRTTKRANESTRLFFYWGESDHWVATRTRDAVIAARASSSEAKSDGRPHMEIDTTGIPHGFCIRHSEAVAEKTAEYILESH